MPMRVPSAAELRELGSELGMTLTDDEVDCYLNYFADAREAYRRLDAIPDNLPEVKYPRTPGYRPKAEENKHGAWYIKTTIKGKSTGKLAGKTAAIKDTVCVAGVPMMVGSSVLEGYMPEVDATLVTRILDAGGTILGKAVTEEFAFSSGSHTAATGLVHNPVKRGYNAGGSSSGSAALVAAGEVDMAIGSDMAGSVRIPAAHCGIVGLLPTYGVIPYTGVAPYEFHGDAVGPLTRTVSDNALFLEAIAGPDGIDTRQATLRPRFGGYTKALGQDVKGLRIALVKEGFGQSNAMPEVDATVREAAKRLAKLGITIEEVSIPWHRDAALVELAFESEGVAANMRGNGYGSNHASLYLNSLGDRIAGWRERASGLNHSFKIGILLGEHVLRSSRGHYYGKAINLTRLIRAAYDAVLADYDLLLMPTAPVTSRPMPPPGAPAAEIIDMAFENVENTSPFNLSHHPAISVPCGLANGLPVGMMLVGNHYDEPTIYRAAYAFEQAVDWRKIGGGAARKSASAKRIRRYEVV